MAKARKEAAAPAVGAPLEQEDDGLRDPLEEALDALGQSEESYTVRLERFNTRNEREYVGSMPLTADLYDDVRREWGGGKYRGRIVPAGGGGYVRHISFRIAGAPRAIDAAPAPAAATPGTVDPVTAEILRTLADIRNDLRERGTQRPLDDALSIVKALREVNGPPAPPADRPAMSEMLETFRGLMAFRQDVLDTAPAPAPSSRGGEYLAIARELGAPLLRLIAKETNQPVPPVTPGDAPAAVAPATPTAPPMPDNTHPVVQFAARLPGAARSWLTRAARDDDDPDDVAQTILETITADADLADLDDVVRRPDFAATLAQAIPTLAHYPGWLASLQLALKEARGLEDVAPALEDVAPPALEGASAPAHNGTPADAVPITSRRGSRARK